MLPDTVNGLPLHPLSVHATVVLVPLAALLAVLFAVPRLRRWALVPLPLVALGAAASTFVSTQTGEALEEALGLEGQVQELIERHEELGKQLLVMVLVFAAVAVVTAAVYGRSLRSDPTRRTNTVVTVLSVLLVLGGVALSVQAYRVSEAGSEAVWNPTGEQDYSTN